MNTAIWILTCAGGAVVAFLVGWLARAWRGPRITHAELSRLRATAPATRNSPDDAPEPAEHQGRATSTSAGEVIDIRDVEPAAQQPSDKSAVVDLRQAEPTATDDSSAAAATSSGVQVSDLIETLDRAPSTTAVHNLQFVPGIGPRLDKALGQNGVRTMADLAGLTDQDLEALGASSKHISAKKLSRRIQPAAQSMLEGAEFEQGEPTAASELRRVDGIGTTMVRWLETQGITTLHALASLSKSEREALQAELTDYPGRIKGQRWVKQARELLEN